MPQIKVYGLAKYLNPIKSEISDVLHSCLADALKLSTAGKCQLFFPLESDNFYYPPDRSDRCLMIEMSMFSGRSVDVKKDLIKLIIQRLSQRFELTVNDIEIMIFEIPATNWGLRGITGDEIK